MDMGRKFRQSKRGVFSSGNRVESTKPEASFGGRSAPERRGAPRVNTANSVEMKGMAKAARRRGKRGDVVSQAQEQDSNMASNNCSKYTRSVNSNARNAPERRGVLHVNTANSVKMKGMARVAR